MTRPVLVGRKLRGLRRSTGVSIWQMAKKLSMAGEDLISIETESTDPKWVSVYMDALGIGDNA